MLKPVALLGRHRSVSTLYNVDFGSPSEIISLVSALTTRSVHLR